MVSIPPQKYLVQQIGKERVRVQVMVEPGASPHAYEPKPRQMAALGETRIYFAAGVEFENAWLKKFTAVNPAMQVVHADRGIPKIPMQAHHHPGEAHGGNRQAAHRQQTGPSAAEHGALDPHIWLSPPLVAIQVGTVLNALQSADPPNGDFYAANAERLLAEIAALDADLKRTFAGRPGLRFMVFHPAWGYLAQAYGLEQVPIELEGKEPKPAQLQALIGQARREGIQVVFVQPQFSAKSAALIAREIGGQVATADPLAEAWMANLRQVAASFAAALK
jgi:zinc transport system substrate-binding protein